LTADNTAGELPSLARLHVSTRGRFLVGQTIHNHAIGPHGIECFNTPDIHASSYST